MKILFSTGECAPFAKTGGLADVAAALPKALKKKKNDIRVIMPCYQKIKEKYDLEFVTYFNFYLGFQSKYCGIFKYVLDDVIYYFIDNEQYFLRGSLYGYPDDGERFSYFSIAVLEAIEKLDFYPDILHVNDWHSAMIPHILNKNYKSKPKYSNIKTLLSIHNIQYQGVFPKEMAILLNLNFDSVMDYDGNINFLKAGIMSSDAINTVSNTYKEEILTDQFSYGLKDVLYYRYDDLYGIVNGIDTSIYNPKTDPNIYKNYSKDAFIKAKKFNKKMFQEEFCYPKEMNDAPLISLISRLTDQKGIDQLIPIIDDLIVHSNAYFFFMGSGESYLENYFNELSIKYSDRIHVYVGYNDSIAQKAYASSDMFLMPSKFEPCGLGQLIALRYGTIPIVRETGGLKDTVIPYNKFSLEGYGFSYKNYNAFELKDTIFRALDVYNFYQEQWKKIVYTAMNLNFGWTESAKKYVDLYKKIIGKVN